MPEEIHALLREADDARSQRDWDQAIERYKAVFEADPTNEEACFKLAELYAVRGLVNSVIDQYFTLMDILEQKEDFDGSVEVAHWIMKLKPDNDKARMKTILIYQKKGDLEEVVKQSLQLARLYIELNQGDQSIELLKNAQEIAPNNLDIGLELAEMYIGHGHIQEGTNQYRKIANAYLSKGKYDKAAEAFRRMKVVVPDDPQLLFTLGNLYMQLNRLDDAEAEFRAILRHNLNHTEALMALGNVCQRKGQFRDAILAFNKILSVNPQNEIAKEKLGELYQAQGATSEAVKHYLAAANTYQYAEETEKAIKLYQRVLTIDPTNPTACRELTNLGAPLEALDADFGRDDSFAMIAPLDVDVADMELSGPSLEEMAGAVVPREAKAGSKGDSTGSLSESRVSSEMERPKSSGAVPSAFGGQGDDDQLLKRNVGDDLVYSGDEELSADLTLDEEGERDSGSKRKMQRKGGGERVGSGLVRKGETGKKAPSGKKAAAADKRSGLLGTHGKPMPKKSGLVSKESKPAGLLHRKKGGADDEFDESVMETAPVKPEDKTVPLVREPEEQEYQSYEARDEKKTGDLGDFDEPSQEQEIPDESFDENFFNDYGAKEPEQEPEKYEEPMFSEQEFEEPVMQEIPEPVTEEPDFMEAIKPMDDLEALDQGDMDAELPSFDDLGGDLGADFNLGQDIPDDDPFAFLNEKEDPELPSFDFDLPGSEKEELPPAEEEPKIDFDAMDFGFNQDISEPEAKPMPEPVAPEAESDNLMDSIYASPEQPRDSSADEGAGLLRKKKKPLKKSLGKKKSFSRDDESEETPAAIATEPEKVVEEPQIEEMVSAEPIMNNFSDDIPPFEASETPSYFNDLSSDDFPSSEGFPEALDFGTIPEMPDMNGFDDLPGFHNLESTPSSDDSMGMGEFPDSQSFDTPSFFPQNGEQMPDFEPLDPLETDFDSMEREFNAPQELDQQEGSGIDMDFPDLTMDDLEIGEPLDFNGDNLEIPGMSSQMDIPQMPDLPDDVGPLDFEGIQESDFDIPTFGDEIPEITDEPVTLDAMTSIGGFEEPEDLPMITMDQEPPQKPEVSDFDLFGGDDGDGFGSFADLLKLAEEIENIVPDEERIREAEERKREEDEKKQYEKPAEEEREELMDTMPEVSVADQISMLLEPEVKAPELPVLPEEEQALPTSFLSEDLLPALEAPGIEQAEAVVEEEEDYSIPVSTSAAAPTSFLPQAEEIPLEEVAMPMDIMEGIELPQEVEVEEEEQVAVAEEIHEEPVPQPEPEPDVEEKIRASLSEGDFGRAFPLYEEAMEKTPDNDELRREYADLCYDYGLIEKALESYSIILSKEPKNYDIRRRIIKGQLIYDNVKDAVTSMVEYGNYLTSDDKVEDAQRVFQFALALDKENSRAREMLSEIYLNQDMKQLALYHLNILAEYLEQQTSVDETIKVLKKIFSLTSDIETQEKLARVYILNGFAANAIVELQSLADRYLQREEYSKAASHYEKVVELDVKHIEAHNKLIELYAHVDDKEKSYREKVTVADLLLERNQMNEARIRYEDCLKTKNQDHSVRRKLVNIYLKLNNLDRALEESKILSEVYHKERRYEEAIVLYNQLIAAQPRNLPLRERLSEFYIMSDQFEKGLEQLIIVAEEFANQQDWDDAIKTYRKALTLDDQKAEIHFRLGEIFLKHKNNPTEARYEFEKVYELDTVHKKSMEYLVNLFIDADKPAKAMGVLKNLIEIDGSFTSMTQKIIDNYRNKVTADANDYKSQFNLGIVYKELEMWKQAIEQFQITRKSNEMALESHCMLGVCFSQQPPMINLAVKTFQKGLELKGFPEKDYLELHYNLGLLYEKLGKAKDAIAEYQEILTVDAHYRDTAAQLKNLKEKANV